MYVADSLFFLQHIFNDKEKDEYAGIVFNERLRDIIRNYEEGKNKPTRSAEEIKNDMIEKSMKLSGNKV